jgi:hypothetical protein
MANKYPLKPNHNNQWSKLKHNPHLIFIDHSGKVLYLAGIHHIGNCQSFSHQSIRLMTRWCSKRLRWRGTRRDSNPHTAQHPPPLAKNKQFDNIMVYYSKSIIYYYSFTKTILTGTHFPLVSAPSMPRRPI